jgi:hypothetical protein
MVTTACRNARSANSFLESRHSGVQARIRCLKELVKIDLARAFSCGDSAKVDHGND